jgi:hypothetical protein
MPARYILRLTFWLKFSSGEFGKILPPPRHSGLEAIPARARPVPFWRHGLRVDLAISLRSSACGCPNARWPDRQRRPDGPALRCSHDRTARPKPAASRFLTLLVQEFQFHRRSLGLDRRTDDDVATLGARHRTLRPAAAGARHRHATTILTLLVRWHTKVTGHALTRENATRILRHTDRTRRIVRTSYRARHGSTKVVALDRAGKPLPIDARNIDLLAGLRRGLHRWRRPASGSLACSAIDTEFLDAARLRHPPWRR